LRLRRWALDLRGGMIQRVSGLRTVKSAVLRDAMLRRAHRLADPLKLVLDRGGSHLLVQSRRHRKRRRSKI
jgi:hypothetical protein